MTDASPATEVVGTFPTTLQAARGMTIVQGRIVVTDDSDRLWWCWPDSPADLIQISGQIPSVTGELECLVYMPRNLVGTSLPAPPGMFPADVAAVWPTVEANTDSGYSFTLTVSGQDRVRISQGIGTQHESYNDPDVLAPILDRIREQDQPGRVILNQPAREIDFAAYSDNPGYIYWVSDTAGSVEYACFSMRREAEGGMADADGGGFWRLNTSHAWPISAIQHAYIITDDWRDGVPEDADDAEVRSNMNARIDAWLEDGVNLLIAFARNTDWDPLEVAEAPASDDVQYTAGTPTNITGGYLWSGAALATGTIPSTLSGVDVTAEALLARRAATGTDNTGLPDNQMYLRLSTFSQATAFATAMTNSTVTHDRSGTVYTYHSESGGQYFFTNASVTGTNDATARAHYQANDTFTLKVVGYSP